MSQAEAEPDSFSWRNAGIRAAIGLAQGLALWQLQIAHANGGWALSRPVVFADLLLITLFVPFVPMGGVGRIRPVVLIAWTAIAAAIAGGIGAYDLIREPLIETGAIRTTPGPTCMLAVVAFLFIAHHLIAPADAARKLIAPYPDYFDTAWKNAVQLILSAAFVGVFWVALFLGAALFSLIGIDAFGKLLEKEWFAFPVTGLAIAAAVQLTDVRVGLIRGVRTVGLVLLSWLLPVATVIAAAFLAALPFTGLAPLFETRSAASILLAAAAGLIILINAAYQDGTEAKTPPFLRWTAMLAAVVLLPLAAIAAFALSLRIGQYGLTPDRVMAMACVTIAGGYALGYAAAAALFRRGWMKLLERVNVVMSLAILATILALFTPLADPTRLSVDDQVGRLKAGAVSPAAFDFGFLRFRSGAHGQAALRRLAEAQGGGVTADIAARAAEAQAMIISNAMQAEGAVAEALKERVTVYPTGAVLPPGFISAAEAGLITSGWCAAPNSQCDAAIADIDGDGIAEIAVFDPYGQPSTTPAQEGSLYIYRLDAAGHWTFQAQYNGPCGAVMAALRTGKPEVNPSGMEVVAGGRRFDLSARDSCGAHITAESLPPAPGAPTTPPGASVER